MSQAHITQEQLNALISGFESPDRLSYTSKVSAMLLPSGIPVIRIDGRTLGLADSSNVVKYVCDQVENLSHHIIIDLAECKYISSFALGSLAKLAKSRLVSGFLLVITGANVMIRDVIALSGLDEYLRVCSSVEEAERVLTVR